MTEKNWLCVVYFFFSLIKLFILVLWLRKEITKRYFTSRIQSYIQSTLQAKIASQQQQQHQQQQQQKNMEIGNTVRKTKSLLRQPSQVEFAKVIKLSYIKFWR